MLSAVITALLFIVMLLIVVSFVASALRERRRHLQVLATQEQSSYQFKAPKRQVTAKLQFQDGTGVGLGKPNSPFHISLQNSLYWRRRTVVSVGLWVMVLLRWFVQSGLAERA